MRTGGLPFPGRARFEPGLEHESVRPEQTHGNVKSSSETVTAGAGHGGGSSSG